MFPASKRHTRQTRPLPDRFDDSGRRVDMDEVKENIFVGSE